LNKASTSKEWVGAQGIIKNILEQSWGRDNNTLVELELTATVISEWETWKVGQVVTIPIYKLELVEAAATVWKVGDLVEFWDEDNDHWQGGRGKVVSVPETNGSVFVRVELTERIPLNELYGVGQVVGQFPENLRVPKLATWNTEAGTNTCGGQFGPCDNCKEAKEEVVEETPKEAVNHPPHYGGDTTYETWKVAEAWGLDEDAYLFNVLKYIARAGKKGSKQEDLEKAQSYLQRRIEHPLGAAK